MTVPDTPQPHWTVKDGLLWFGDAIPVVPSRMPGVAVRNTNPPSIVIEQTAYDALVADVGAARDHWSLRESIAAEAEQVGGDDHHYTDTDVRGILLALLHEERSGVTPESPEMVPITWRHILWGIAIATMMVAFVLLVGLAASA